MLISHWFRFQRIELQQLHSCQNKTNKNKEKNNVNSQIQM